MLEKRWLFLDDTEARHRVFDAILKDLHLSIRTDHVRTVDEALGALRSVRYDCVFLDHDLEETDPEFTGMAVALFIADHQDISLRPRHVVVHSWNVSAAIVMADVLKAAGISVSRVEFGV